MTTFPNTQTREAHVSNKERVGRIERAALTYTHYLSLAQHHTIGRRLSLLAFSWEGKEKTGPYIQHADFSERLPKGLAAISPVSECCWNPSYSSGTTENKTVGRHTDAPGDTVQHKEANIAQQPLSQWRKKRVEHVTSFPAF